MRIILSESTSEATMVVAEMMLKRVESHPSSVLGLATGQTMVPVYESWVKLARDRSVNHDKSFFFLLDEYLGLELGHPSSFESFLKNHFFSHLKIKRNQYALPPVHGLEVEEAATSYERTIKESAGIDVQLLGIGRNGHIGFNEPGSTGGTRTRKVFLTDETKEANKGQFQEGMMPGEAISMGIGTILESRAIILLATGKSKADAIKHLTNHHDDPSCPATFLKSHPHFTLVLDPEAASKINLKM